MYILPYFWDNYDNSSLAKGLIGWDSEKLCEFRTLTFLIVKTLQMYLMTKSESTSLNSSIMYIFIIVKLVSISKQLCTSVHISRKKKIIKKLDCEHGSLGSLVVKFKQAQSSSLPCQAHTFSSILTQIPWVQLIQLIADQSPQKRGPNSLESSVFACSLNELPLLSPTAMMCSSNFKSCDLCIPQLPCQSKLWLLQKNEVGSLRKSQVGDKAWQVRSAAVKRVLFRE